MTWPSSSLNLFVLLALQLTRWRLPSSGVLRCINSLHSFLCVLSHSTPLQPCKFIQWQETNIKNFHAWSSGLSWTRQSEQAPFAQNPVMLPILSKVESRIFAMASRALLIGPYTACPTASSFLSSSHKGLFAIAENCQTCFCSGATVSPVPSAGNVLTQMTAGLNPSLYSGLCSKNKLSESPSTIP